MAKSEEEEEEREDPKKPTAEELLQSELPKVSDEEGPQDHDGYSKASEGEEEGNEHTLNDLASEDPQTKDGVEPSRPKSFFMDQDEPKNLNQQIPSSGVYGDKRGGGKKKTLLLLVITLLVVGGLVYLLKGRLLGTKEETSPSPSPTIAEETPTPTPTPSIDRSKFSVDILNGSGKTGLAASVSAKLKDLGYKTGKTANATNSAFTRTQVLAKSSAKDVVNILIKDLSPDYDATSGGLLQDSAASDLEVIIGAK